MDPEPALPCPPHLFVDTEESVALLMDNLRWLPLCPPRIYMDLEGEDLSRHGTISIMQIYLAPRGEIYLVDVLTLGDRAFNTPGSDGFTTLKMVLENPACPKVIFDVRNDSDALFAHYGIALAGTHDLQLMELICRPGGGRFVCGLGACVQHDLPLTEEHKAAWMRVKEKGRKLLSPEAGGSYAVLNTRPLSEDIKLYCIQDITLFPWLWHGYAAQIRPLDWYKLLEWSAKRVVESHAPNYQPRGPGRMLAPNW